MVFNNSYLRIKLFLLLNNKILIICKTIILKLRNNNNNNKLFHNNSQPNKSNKYKKGHNNKFNRFLQVIMQIIFIKFLQAKVINIISSNNMADNHPSLKEKFQEEM